MQYRKKIQATNFIAELKENLPLLYFRYLQEIGYTDTIIDVRSNRVRSLLGLNNNTDSEDMNTPALNGNEGTQERQESSDINLMLPGKQQKKVETNKHLCLFQNPFENNEETWILLVLILYLLNTMNFSCKWSLYLYKRFWEEGILKVDISMKMYIWNSDIKYIFHFSNNRLL